jgi:hypothetical protein
VLNHVSNRSAFRAASLSAKHSPLWLNSVFRTQDCYRSDDRGRKEAAIKDWRDAGAPAHSERVAPGLTANQSTELLDGECGDTYQPGVHDQRSGGWPAHAQDRALEAVAYAYAEMAECAGGITWEKPQAKIHQSREKRYKIVPRGLCSR